MDERTLIQISMPKDFSIELDKLILSYKERGVTKTSKAELIIKFARVGLLKEKLMNIESER